MTAAGGQYLQRLSWIALQIQVCAPQVTVERGQSFVQRPRRLPFRDRVIHLPFTHIEQTEQIVRRGIVGVRLDRGSQNSERTSAVRKNVGQRHVGRRNKIG